MAATLNRKRGDTKEEDKLTRIAIVNPDKCKPKRCKQECKKYCPVVKMGKLCIEVETTSKIAIISEELCIGCGICPKKCPFGAIQIVNLPKDLDRYTTHRYGPNSFKLHRLPIPRPGQCLGLVGSNGTGKSTALKILAGKLKPNLGLFTNPPDWEEILKYFRGSELQAYFQKVLEDKLRALIKPQYVDQIPKAVKGTVGEVLRKKDERNLFDKYVDLLDLRKILDRDVTQLSGGELQRFTLAITCVQEADVYMFDEPSSYLDVKQRINAARCIRGLMKNDNYVICVEHDLSVLDYLSDFICCLYGQPGAYGVVTMPFGVREGINIFLDGFVPTENLRFREDALNFKISDADLGEVQNQCHAYKYPDMTKTLGDFKLRIKAGEFSDSEIIALLGENATGKTTFIQILAGIIKPDEGDAAGLPQLNISVKPQTLNPKFQGTVKELFQSKIPDAYLHPQFQVDVLRPLQLHDIMDQQVQTISGGELQRVAIVLALGKPADLYLLDEPSAFLDCEQRLAVSKVIKRFILHAKKTAFVVEHDFIMATYLADRVIVYEGEPSINAFANAPESSLTGINKFLKSLNVTFRHDPDNFRPRINKEESVKDREQKASGNYFYLDPVGLRVSGAGPSTSTTTSSASSEGTSASSSSSDRKGGHKQQGGSGKKADPTAHRASPQQSTGGGGEQGADDDNDDVVVADPDDATAAASQQSRKSNKAKKMNKLQAAASGEDRRDTAAASSSGGKQGKQPARRGKSGDNETDD